MSPGQGLAGCVVLITCDRRSGDLRAALERRGATTLHAPTLATTPPRVDDDLVRETRALVRSAPDVVVVTTATGFRGWLEAADAAGLGTDLQSALEGARILARGPEVDVAVRAVGLEVVGGATSDCSAGVRDALLAEGVAGQRVAIQHHGAVDQALTDDLVGAGAAVSSVVVHRWGPPADRQAVALGIEAAATGEVDAVLFTSAPTASAWVDAATAAGVLPRVAALARAGRLLVAAIGEVTAHPLRSAGIEPLLPEHSRLGSLVRAVLDHHEQLGPGAVETVGGPLRVRSSAAVLGDDVLPVSPNGLAVLRVLADARGRVVPRSALLAALPGDPGSGHALEMTIARLREALGDRRVVETVVRRGYRLALTEGAHAVPA